MGCSWCSTARSAGLGRKLRRKSKYLSNQRLHLKLLSSKFYILQLLNNLMELSDLLKGARQHVTDSSALFAVSTPVGAFFENVLTGMSDETSIKSRLIVGGLYLGGLGGILGHLRDRSRERFNITEQTKERYQQIHDMAYIAATAFVLNPLIYIGAGTRNVKEIAVATLLATGFSFFSGGVMGYAVDLFRDLTNYQSSLRVPEKVRNASPTLKKCLVGGILVASVGLASLVYSLTPH